MPSARDIEIAERLLSELSLPLDRLPYTSLFDEVYTKFLRHAGTNHSQHEVWWAMLHARKRGLGPRLRRQRRDRPA